MTNCVQLSIFDIINKPKKTKQEEDVLFAVNHGSGFEHGKARILNFYNRQNPSVQEFAQYLRDEYGLGGCGGGGYDCAYDSSGIRFKRNGVEYSFNWLQWAKETARIIENDEYNCENELKYCTYYKERSDSRYLTKKYILLGKLTTAKEQL